MIRTIRVLVTGALLGGALTVASASPAAASCLANPAPSPYAFSGRVVATKWDGRFARVRTRAGRLVIVKGGDHRRQITSVDRSYQVNQRYVFHPINSRSPYRDNLCTATHPV